MIVNVDEQQNQGEYVPAKGIGLYKLNYEMDVKGSDKENGYIAGVMAYSSDEAVKTLVEFGKASVKGFKGVRVHQVSYEGPIHTMSKAVKKAVLHTAVMEGKVVTKEDYDAAVKASKGTKKSIIPKKDG